MDKAGLMRIGALLAVLAVLAGVFAAAPYWTARAANKTVWGLVDECGSQEPSYLQNVIVSLIDAHSGAVLTNSTWRDGSFSFTPAPASYLLRFQIADHYTRDYPRVPPNPPGSSFRFDGSVDVNINECLEKMPTRDRSLTVLVVDQTSTTHFNEDLTTRFPRTFVSNENIASAVNPTTGIANVSRHPVVKPSYTLTWSAPGSSFTLQEPADYTWPNLFTGTVQISNPTILSSLQLGASGKWLNVSYQFSGTSARLSYFPVVPGSYTIYKNTVSWMLAEDTEWRLNADTGWLTVLGSFVFGTDTLSATYSSTGAVPGATVNIFNTTKKQTVASGSTLPNGTLILNIWGSSADLELQVQKEGYQLYAAPINTAAVNSTRVVLPNGVTVFGVAFKAGGGGVVNTNVVGYLYNTNIAVPLFKKVIAAKVSGALYIFTAEPNQNYRMIIDADGYKAADVPVSVVTSAVRQNVTLSPSLKEEYRSSVTYDNANWNTMWINRTLTLRPDTTVPGLDLAGIRSLALQIDYTLGNKNGGLEVGEVTAFQNWLRSRLADYITTEGFVTTNSLVHNSSAASYNVIGVTPAPSLLTPTAIFVNTTAAYTVSGTTQVPNGKSKYFANITTPNDTNTTQYKDQVVVVKLPKGYEMTQKKVTGSITTTGWTTITVDPGLATGNSRIDMTIEKSANGTARAMAEKPADKFYVLEDSLKNYTVVVAADTNITFNANQSSDPNRNIKDANFTWRFANGTVPGDLRYNITTMFNYTRQILGRHDFTVNLTVVEAGGNRTYRDFKVFVDDTPPVAIVRHNRTVPVFTGNQNGTTLRINEDVPIKFDATGSSDTVYAGAPAWLAGKDKIPDVEGRRGYRWDYDADNITDSNLARPVKPFEKPGWYNTTLQVMDWVGHLNGINATIHVIVNDTTKPTPNFVILDPSNDWVVTTTLVEGKNYTFNASSSSDNYDDNANLTYHWYFPGPVVNASLQNGHWYNGTLSERGRLSWNITVRWTQFNLSYNVTLNVTDRGFRDPTQPQKPNSGNRTNNVAVSVDVKKHPDLKYVAASLKIEPAQPEEGQLINVSLMIENVANRANATSVNVLLIAKDSNGAEVLKTGPTYWRDANWSATTDRFVETGKRVRLIFMISFPAQGNKSLEVRFNDTMEPYTWVDSQNRVSGSVFVKLAGWVLPAAIGGIIAAIILVAIGGRTYSRYKAGELVFRRKEKKEKKEKKRLEEKEEEEEEEPEPEEKEKKRL